MKKINLKKYLTSKITFVVLIALIAIISIVLILINKEPNLDKVKYKDKTYYLLEYNQDVFTYNFYYNDYLKEELVQPIEHDKWDIVYLNGDLFLPKNEVKKATEYYSDDKNYDWFIIIEKDDTETIIPLTITEEELEYIYDLDNKERKETMVFEDIEMFADITKISKDKTIFAPISLARVDHTWYWKTEIMTDDDREYIIEVPETLNSKLNDILK